MNRNLWFALATITTSACYIETQPMNNGQAYAGTCIFFFAMQALKYFKYFVFILRV